VPVASFEMIGHRRHVYDNIQEAQQSPTFIEPVVVQTGKE
jgi:hypothetical protein